MRPVDLERELPAPAGKWRVTDDGRVIASGDGLSIAPRTVAELIAMLPGSSGSVPVLDVDVSPQAVVVRYASGCLTCELIYATGVGPYAQP